jgi:hypothetical protein
MAKCEVCKKDTPLHKWGTIGITAKDRIDPRQLREITLYICPMCGNVTTDKNQAKLPEPTQISKPNYREYLDRWITGLRNLPSRGNSIVEEVITFLESLRK